MGSSAARLLRVRFRNWLPGDSALEPAFAVSQFDVQSIRELCNFLQLQLEMPVGLARRLGRVFEPSARNPCLDDLCFLVKQVTVGDDKARQPTGLNRSQLFAEPEQFGRSHRQGSQCGCR